MRSLWVPMFVLVAVLATVPACKKKTEEKEKPAAKTEAPAEPAPAPEAPQT